MSFKLDERLAVDTVEVCQLKLGYVGLLNDVRYPWLVLVPQKPELVEVTDLNEGDRALLWREVEQCCGVMQALYPEAKLNIGALGIIVRQLHIHIIARHENDAAWPGPVWGVGKAEPYGDVGLTETLNKIRQTF